MTTLASFKSKLKYLSELKNHSISSEAYVKKIKRKKKKHMKRWFLIIVLGLGMVAAFWLAGFYCLLLDPGKTIINLIIFFPAFVGNTKELKQCPWAAQPYCSD